MFISTAVSSDANDLTASEDVKSRRWFATSSTFPSLVVEEVAKGQSAMSLVLRRFFSSECSFLLEPFPLARGEGHIPASMLTGNSENCPLSNSSCTFWIVSASSSDARRKICSRILHESSFMAS